MSLVGVSESKVPKSTPFLVSEGKHSRSSEPINVHQAGGHPVPYWLIRRWYK